VAPCLPPSFVSTRWLVAACAFAVPFVPALSRAQGEDLIDTASLDARGVVFDSGGLGRGGLSVAVSIGDFNGDGMDDLFTYGREAGLVDRDHSPGLLSLVFGRPGLTGRLLLGDPTVPALNLRYLDIVADRGGGGPLRPAGDLDADGFADAFICIPEYRRGGTLPGRVCLLYGSSTLSGDRLIEDIGDGVRGTVFHSTSARYQPGLDAANIGDFNGDGNADLAILGFFNPPELPGASRPALFVAFQTAALPSRVTVNELGTDRAGFILHWPAGFNPQTVASAGDVNGDGLQDILVLLIPKSSQIGTPGRVHLLYGRRNPEPLIDLQDIVELEFLAEHGIVTFLGPANPSHLSFGGREQAAGVGDLNGDSFADILIGAAYTYLGLPGAAPEVGTARIFYGRPDFPPLVYYDAPPEGSSTWIHGFHEDDVVSDAFGFKTAAAGDVDADGVPDFLIGAPYATVAGQSMVGEAYLLFGDRAFPLELQMGAGFQGLRILGETKGDVLGDVLGGSGDFSGDGALDIFLGTRARTDDPEARGHAYIIYGTGSRDAPFTVLAMNPAAGALRGGTTVTIQGSGFRDGVTVEFGSTAATRVEVISGVELRVLTPPSTRLGPVDVTLRLQGETRRLGEPFQYTQNLPDINLASPGSRGLRVDGVPGAETGHSLAFGDLDGDAMDDLLIGSLAPDGPIRVTVVRGGPGLPEALPAFDPSPRVTQVETTSFPTNFWVRLNAVGDVNGDGVTDLGVSGTDSTGFLVFGRRDLPETLFVNEAVADGTVLELLAAAPDATFLDFIFTGLGDLTGDGIDDFAVGLANPAGVTPGRILFLAGRTTWPQVVDLHQEAFASVVGRTVGLGYEIGVAGDVDGDGVLELLGCCEEAPEPSRAYLIPLLPALDGTVAVDTLLEERGGTTIERSEREWVFSHFIHAKAAGDVNGDGHPDLVVSDEGGADGLRGVTFVIPGGPDLAAKVSLPTTPPDPPDGITRILGSSQRVQSGRALGPAGDFNGDGFADFLIGEQNLEPFSPGNMFLVFGDAALPPEIRLHRPGRHALRLGGTQEVTRLDVSTPRARDLNGDGREDFAFSEMGSPRFPSEDGTPSAGVVHVVYGLPLAVPFRRGDANFDADVNISDAIFILSFLFLGGPAPLCEDAADADDSGLLDITDAVRILNALFLGNASLPEPSPEAGEDPTGDELGCLGF